MAEKEKKSSGQAKTWFEGLRSEFKKIIWPDKLELTRQTAAVVSVSVVLGVLIALIDFMIQHGVDVLVNLG